MQKRCLIFDGWNTAIDGHFTLSSFSFSLPDIQEQRQEISGMDGDLDYTDALAGRPIFKTRQLKATLSSTWGKREERIAIFRELVNRVHGKRCAIELPDRPGLVAHGRVTVALKTDHPAYTEVDITATCDPFLTHRETRLASAPLLSRSCNVPTAKNVTLLADYTTAENAAFADYNTMFSINSGEIGSVAVWKITAEGNKRYFAAARIFSGRGEWSVSADPVIQTAENGYIETDSSGEIYLRLKKYSSETVSLMPVLILPVENLTKMDAGAAATQADAVFSGSSSGVPSIAVLFNNALEVWSAPKEFSWALSPGENIAAFMLWRGTASGELKIAWKKVEL